MTVSGGAAAALSSLLEQFEYSGEQSLETHNILTYGLDAVVSEGKSTLKIIDKRPLYSYNILQHIPQDRQLLPSLAYSPAGQGADEGGVARADDRPGQHCQWSVLEALVEQRLRHPRGLPVQQRPDGLGGEVSQAEASAPGGEQQVHALRYHSRSLCGTPLRHYVADGLYNSRSKSIMR